MNPNIIKLDQSSAVTANDAGLNMAVMLCNKLHAEIKYHKETYQSKTVYLGFQLVRAKESLPHGEFGKLFKKKGESNVKHALHLDFTRQTGNTYMSFFKKRLVDLKRKQLADDFTRLLEQADADPEALCDFMGRQYPDFVSIRDEMKDDSRATYTPSVSQPNAKGQIKDTPEEEHARAVAAATETVKLLTERLRLINHDGTLLLAEPTVTAALATAIKSTIITLQTIK